MANIMMIPVMTNSTIALRPEPATLELPFWQFCCGISEAFDRSGCRARRSFNKMLELLAVWRTSNGGAWRMARRMRLRFSPSGSCGEGMFPLKDVLPTEQVRESSVLPVTCGFQARAGRKGFARQQ